MMKQHMSERGLDDGVEALLNSGMTLVSGVRDSKCVMYYEHCLSMS